MSYTRKTRDTWQIHVNYGQGWEHEITEDTYAEARQRRREYRENCPQYPAKIVRRRERITDADSVMVPCPSCGASVQRMMDGRLIKHWTPGQPTRICDASDKAV